MANSLAISTSAGTLVITTDADLSPGPLVANAGSDVGIDEGNTTQLAGSATGGAPPYEYAWTPSDGLSNSAIANPICSITTTQEYTLTVLDSELATDYDTMTVTVTPAVGELIANAGADDSMYVGDTAVFDGSASGGVPPYTYAWTPVTGLDDPTSATPTCSATETTTYTLTVTDNASTTDADTMTMTVNAVPDPGERPLGINLGQVRYYSSDLSFVDIMKTADPWVTPAFTYPTDLTYDANGWPTTLGASEYLLTLLCRSMSGNYPSGTYHIFYDGTGTFSVFYDAASLTYVEPGHYTFTVATPSNIGIGFRLNSIDAGDPIHNIRIIMPGHEATYDTQPFHPTLLARLQSFDTIRFMDWMWSNYGYTAVSGNSVSGTANTVVLPSTASAVDDAYNGMVVNCTIGSAYNHCRIITDYDGTSKTATITPDWDTGVVPTTGAVRVYYGAQKDWADRPTTSIWSYATLKGVPMELMVALCNATNCNMWINVPWYASDDWVAGAAAYIHANLTPPLKVYLEWSNEVWNGGFAYQYNWAIGKGMEAGLDPTNRWAAGYRYTSQRSVEIAAIFDDEFEESHVHSERTSSRIVRVVAGQAAGAYNNNTYLMGQVTGGHPAYYYLDALAIGGYWGGVSPTIDDYEVSALARNGAADTSHIVLASAWSATDDKYNGRTIEITAGTNVGETRTVTDYVGSTRTAEVDTPFTSIPDSTSMVKRHSKTTEQLLAMMAADLEVWYNTYMAANVINAKENGMDTLVYEGGTHNNQAVSTGSATSPAALMTYALCRHADMLTQYQTALDYWKGYGLDINGHGPKLWVAFNAIQSWNHYGCWGHLEYINSDPLTVYRWKAMVDWSALNHKWWTD